MIETVVELLRGLLPDPTPAREAAAAFKGEALWSGPLVGPTTLDRTLADIGGDAMVATILLVIALGLLAWFLRDLRRLAPGETVNRLKPALVLGFAVVGLMDGIEATSHFQQLSLKSDAYVVLAPTRIVRLQSGERTVYPANAVNAIQTGGADGTLSFRLTGTGKLTIDAEPGDLASLNTAADRIAAEAAAGVRPLTNDRG